jgi:hypothetical protein
MRVLIWVVLLAMYTGALSQQPTPRTAKGGQQPQTQSKNAEPAAAKDERGTEQFPIIVKALPSEHTYTKTQSEQQHEEEKATYDRLVAYSTVALAVITFFLALYTAKLWKATVNLGKDAKEAAARQASEMQESLMISKDSAVAAMKSADAAERTVKTMDRTAENQLRAYVYVEEARITNVANPDVPAGLIVNLSNRPPAWLRDPRSGPIITMTYQKHWPDSSS